MKNLIATLLIACGGCVSTQQVMAQTCGTYANPCAEPTFNPNAYQVSTAGNAGNLTWNMNQGLDGTYTQIPPPNLCPPLPAPSVTGCTYFNPIMQDFSGVIQADLTGYYTSDADALAAGGGIVVTSLTWNLYGTNGSYSAGRVAGTDQVIVSQVSIVPAVPTSVLGPGYGANSPLETIYQWAPIPGAVALLADGTTAQFVPVGNGQALSNPANVLRSGRYLVSFTATGCTGHNCGAATYRYFFSHVAWTSHHIAPPPPPCTDCGD